MNAYKHTKYIPFIAIALPVAIITTNLIYDYWTSQPTTSNNIANVTKVK